MLFLNITLIFLALPIVIWLSVLSKKDGKGQIVRVGCGTFAITVMLCFVTFIFEMISSEYQDFDSLTVPSALRFANLAMASIFIILSIFIGVCIIKNISRIIAFIISAGFTIISTVAGCLCSFYLTEDYSAPVSQLIIPAAICFAIFALFFTANTLLTFDKKMQKIILSIVNSIFGISTIFLLTSALNIGQTELSLLEVGLDVVSAIISVVIFAIIAAPALVSIGSLISQQIAISGKKIKR